MIYRSNLVAPDLTPYFRLTTFDHYAGHTFLADPEFDSRCGFFTHDEAAILYNIAVGIAQHGQRKESAWLDIGARTGWTAAHIIAAGGYVVALEPEYYRDDFRKRAIANITPVREKYQYGQACFLPWAVRSEQYFALEPMRRMKYDGFVIDGNHDEPEPLRDAQGCLPLAYASAVFVIHDFIGGATWQAAEWLMDQGFHLRTCWTPNMIGVCWRGFDGWVPPAHHADPEVIRMYRHRLPAALAKDSAA